MILPRGKQTELGPVKTASGFEAFTNKVLVSLLGLLYSIKANKLYDEVFEILRLRGVFKSKEDVVHEPY